MRIYPDLPGPRTRAIVADLAVVCFLLGCILVGTWVHDTVSRLDVLGRGVQGAGTQVRDSFDRAGRAVDGAPVVGDELEDAFRDAGRTTSDPVIGAGTRGREAVSDVATMLGWLVGGLPALTLLLPYVPWRVWRARRLLAARRIVELAEASPERRRLLAMRAAFGLPLTTLLRHTDDPLGDVEAGRYEPLLAALGARHGLRLGARAGDAR